LGLVFHREIAMRLFPGISFLTLGVSNVDRATLFYERLGWRRSRAASSRAETVFELNNLLLRLSPSDALALDAGAPESSLMATYAQYYGDVESVARTLEIAGSAGAKLLRERRQGNGACAAFADPDGHVWNLVHDPRMIPSADGAVRPPA
jgi:predicted lactoylglutathione lyase